MMSQLLSLETVDNKTLLSNTINKYNDINECIKNREDLITSIIDYVDILQEMVNNNDEYLQSLIIEHPEYIQQLSDINIRLQVLVINLNLKFNSA